MLTRHSFPRVNAPNGVLATAPNGLLKNTMNGGGQAAFVDVQ